MRVERLLLGTSNPGKIDEWKRLLGETIELVSADSLDISSPEESGEVFKEVAIEKAKHYSAKSKMYVLSEDGGFEIDAMGGLPGVKSRRILPGEKEGTDQELIDFVMNKLKDVPKEKRGARLVVYVVLSDPNGNIVFEDRGAIEGYVPHVPAKKFEEGYPYRATLFLPDAGKTYAELSIKEHGKHNHRVPIAERIRRFLLEYEIDD